MIPELHANLVERIGRYTSLRKEGLHEYAGPCPRCGGKDRFKIRDDRGWFCRNCTGVPGDGEGHWKDWADFTALMFNWTLKQTLQQLGVDRRLTPAEVAAFEAERKAAEAKQREEERITQAQVHDRLTSCPEWRNYAENVQQDSRARELWNKRGLSDRWINYYGVGYCPSRRYSHGDEFFESDSLTMPYFRPVSTKNAEGGDDVTWRVIGLQHRLLIPNPPGGKYRPHLRGAGKHLFYADIFQNGPTTCDLLIVEGEAKAMVTQAAMWTGEDAIAPNLSVIGVPGKGWKEEWITEFRQSPQVFICLDPDATDSARKLAAAIGPQARVVLLPDKIDDLIVMGILDGWKLLEILEN